MSEGSTGNQRRELQQNISDKCIFDKCKSHVTHDTRAEERGEKES